jgi:uncharacterized Ntn-hydrolase superfamily protein
VTFSIAACDLDAGQWGVAVASKFLAVGSVVPWLEGGVGAVATQALANTAYGPQGLALMRSGLSAREALDQLLAADRGRADRQAGMVDGRGRSATHTGESCLPWAGGRTGRGYAAQGNILAGPTVIDAMADAFEGTAGSVAVRLMAALGAGDAAGGDRRGRQSAALAVVSPGGGYGGQNDVAVDLRVDDHADPVAELARLHGLHELLYGETSDADKIPLEGAVAEEVRELLILVGHPPGGDEGGLQTALRAWVGAENLEERWWGEDALDPVVLDHLRRQAAGARAG